MSKNLNDLTRINNFFEAYARAVETYDTKKMVTYHALPCLFLSDDTSSTFTDATKLEALFNQAAVFYKQFGIAHARPEIWTKRTITERIISVKVNWQYYDAENQPIYNCDFHYVLKLDKKDNWKIEMCVDINEKERSREWQEQHQKA